MNPDADGWVNPRRPLTAKPSQRGRPAGGAVSTCPAFLCTFDSPNPDADGWVTPHRPLVAQHRCPTTVTAPSTRSNPSNHSHATPTAMTKTSGGSVGGVNAPGGSVLCRKLDVVIAANHQQEAGDDFGLESPEDLEDPPSLPWELAGETWDEAVAEAEEYMVEVFGSDYLRLCDEAKPPSDES